MQTPHFAKHQDVWFFRQRSGAGRGTVAHGTHVQVMPRKVVEIYIYHMYMLFAWARGRQHFHDHESKPGHDLTWTQARTL